ncbi:MAG: hypothetical protein UV36_C0044G0005, partial [Parcubacteria group bacterium GW2011_GWC2_42_6]
KTSTPETDPLVTSLQEQIKQLQEQITTLQANQTTAQTAVSQVAVDDSLTELSRLKTDPTYAGGNTYARVPNGIVNLLTPPRRQLRPAPSGQSRRMLMKRLSAQLRAQATRLRKAIHSGRFLNHNMAAAINGGGFTTLTRIRFKILI